MANNTRKKSGGCLSWFLFFSILIGGGNYVYSKFFRGGEFKALTIEAAAQTLPEQTMMMTFIDTDPQSWSKLAQFETTPTQNLIQEIQPKSFKENPINYQQDIQPWLENAVLAFFPDKNQVKDELSADFLIVLGIKDRDKALQFIQKIKSQSPQKIKESQFQNITLSEIVIENNLNLTYAIAGNQLLVSPQRTAIESAINAKNGQSSLAQKEESKAIFAEKLNLVNPVVQVYFTDSSGLMQEAIASSSENISPEQLQEMGQIKSMMMGMGVEDQGLHFQAITQLEPTVTPTPLQNNPNKLLSQFPADTLMFVNGQGISQWWSLLVQQSQKSSSLKSFLDENRLIVKNMTNLDLDRDILGWMDGEFALGIITADSGTLGDLGIGGILALETSDRTTANRTLDNLKTQIPAFVQFQQIDIQGISVSQAQTFQNQTAFSYGWRNDNLLLLSVGSPLTKMIETQPNNSLAQSPDFLKMTASLPKQNTGYFYLNFDQGMTVAKKSAKAAGQTIPPDTEKNLDLMIGMAATATSPDPQTSQLDLILALKAKQ